MTKLDIAVATPNPLNKKMFPRASYLICATPRSGSTLLCTLLASSGVAGLPAEYFEYLKHTGLPIQGGEFFVAKEMDPEHHRQIARILDDQPIETDDARLRNWKTLGYRREFAHILDVGTSQNGTFAAKMMWGYLSNFLDLVNSDRARTSSEITQTLGSLFPNVRYVRIRRMDKLRQAISLWKAIQTQNWRQDVERDSTASMHKARQPVFHFAAIRYLQNMLLLHDQAWGEFFNESRIAPYTVSYEGLVEDMERTVCGVLDFLEIPQQQWPEQFQVPTLLKQRNYETELWVKRYLSQSSQAEISSSDIESTLASRNQNLA